MNIIIFDMDGTLIDSAKAITININDMRKKVGLEPNLEQDHIVRVINDPDANYLEEFYPGITVTKVMMDEFEVEFKKNYDLHARAYSGVKELLKSLKEKGFYIALASNAPQSSLEAVLIRNDIRPYFDYIIGYIADEIPKKPDPKMLLKVLEDAQSEQKDNIKAIFIGDSHKDMLASKNANIPYLQVTWGFGSDIEGEKNVSNTKEAYNYILNYFYHN
ncbi:MAG: HAD family hydrolase [Campylobacteraceae bacterium]|nr:HAD family hydrolase [Campylobacteraceae bacterium]